MAKEWKLSCYTNIIKCESGDILLHNSFMGAIARIPVHQVGSLERFLEEGAREEDMSNPAIKELCVGGFFVPSNLDESKVIAEVLDKEREMGRFRIIVLPHENCNFRCVYCYEKFERGKMTRDIVRGLKTLVSRKVKVCSQLIATWFGGEPLLAQDVIYELSDFFIEDCVRNRVTYVSGMTTNGYLLTPHVVDSLLRRKVKSYQVTLDGPEEIHNANRRLKGGGNTYRRILDNLVGMRDRDAEFLVRIRINFNKDSIPFIEQWLTDEMVPLFANDARFTLDFQPIGKWGGPNDSTLEVCDSESASSARFAFFKKAISLGFSDQVVKDYLMPHGNVCYAGRDSSLVVGADGRVYKCTREFDSTRNAVGRLASDGKLSIHNKLANLWTKLEDKDTTWCSSCSYYPSCQGRNCPRIAIDQKKPICSISRKEYETLVKIVAFGNTSKRLEKGPIFGTS